MQGSNVFASPAKSNNAKWDSSSLQAKQVSALQMSPTTSPRSLKEKKEPQVQASWDYASCIAMINASREKLGLNGLSRDTELDKMAQMHAQSAADNHGSQTAVSTEFHGHILRGSSAVSIHAKVVEAETGKARTNIFNPDFHLIGIGIAKATSDGNKTYVCELFRGKYTLSLEDMD